MKKLFFLAAAAIFAFTACEKQQSELNLEGNVKKATISGQLVYLQDHAGAATEEIAVANQRVYFEVAGTTYSGTAASGNLYFAATTDANGAYTISVPVGAKSIAGNLKTDQIKLDKDGKAIYLKNTTKAITVVADENRAEKIIAAIDNVLTDCQGSCTVKGKISYNAGVVEKGGVKEDGLVAAPAGVIVTIAAKFDDNNTRTFTTETKADGSYEIAIPCYASKTLNATVNIAQFEGTFTELVNNKYLTVKAIYYLATAKSATLKDGTQQVVDITAAKLSSEDPTTKNTKFKVKGEIKVACESYTYSKTDKDADGNYSKITGVEKSSKAYNTNINGGKFQIKLVHKEGKTDESSIIYDMTIGDKGKYEKEVAIYDTWKYSDVKVYIIIDKFAVDNYKHYYYTYQYEEDEIWKTNTYGWCEWTSTEGIKKDWSSSQNCAGTYELKAGGNTPDGFFDVTVDGTASFTMSADSKAALRGVGKANIDKPDGTHTLYMGGLTY